LFFEKGHKKSIARYFRHGKLKRWTIAAWYSAMQPMNAQAETIGFGHSAA